MPRYIILFQLIDHRILQPLPEADDKLYYLSEYETSVPRQIR